jgi:type I restriction enzyme S subunit
MNLVRLGDVLEVQNGFAFPSENFRGPNCGMPLIRIRDLGATTTEATYAGPYRDDFVVSTGDLLIGMDGDFECHRWEGPPALLNQRVCRLRNFIQGVDPDFVRLWIGRELEAIHAGTSFVTVKHLSSKQIANLKLPLLPFDEQRRVVDLLSRAAGLKRLAEKAQATARELIPALFVRTFGDPAGNPKGWPTLSLGELGVRFVGGKNLQAGPENGSPYRILKISAVTSGTFKAAESKPAPAGYEAPTSHLLRHGDVLFSRANTEELVGASAKALAPPSNLLLPDKLWRIEVPNDAKCSKEFLFRFLQHPSIRRELSRMASGTGGSMKNISQRRLIQLRVLCPPQELQTAFEDQVQFAESTQDRANEAAIIAERAGAALMARLFAR